MGFPVVTCRLSALTVTRCNLQLAHEIVSDLWGTCALQNPIHKVDNCDHRIGIICRRHSAPVHQRSRREKPVLPERRFLSFMSLDPRDTGTTDLRSEHVKKFKITLFIRTKRNMRVFGVIPSQHMSVLEQATQYTL